MTVTDSRFYRVTMNSSIIVFRSKVEIQLNNKKLEILENPLTQNITIKQYKNTFRLVFLS